MVATTWAEGSSAPVITTSSESTPPLSEVTSTSDGGTFTLGMLHVLRPFAIVGATAA